MLFRWFLENFVEPTNISGYFNIENKKLDRKILFSDIDLVDLKYKQNKWTSQDTF